MAQGKKIFAKGPSMFVLTLSHLMIIWATKLGVLLAWSCCAESFELMWSVNPSTDPVGTSAFA